MPEYYVNKNAQPTGEHEVHRADYCPTPAAHQNRQPLGWFNNCHEAVREAEKYYDNVDGCANCSPECHAR